MNRAILIRAFVRAAKLSTPASPQTALENIIVGRFTSDISEGKTIIRTQEAGGEVQFAIAAAFGPAEVMELAEEALEWLLQQPDPVNPNLTPRLIKRLRVSFKKVSNV